MSRYESHHYDVIVIGAGGAGLRAAVEVRARGLRVAVICKSLLGKAHTVMAEGGVAAARGNVYPEDNWQVHFRDPCAAGRCSTTGGWPRFTPKKPPIGSTTTSMGGVSLRGQLGPHATQALDGLRPGGRWIGFQIPVHARCRQLAARIRRSEWQCRADQIRAAGPVPEPLAGCRRRRRAPGSQPGWRRPPGGRAARRRPSRVYRGWRARRRAGRCRGR